MENLGNFRFLVLDLFTWEIRHASICASVGRNVPFRFFGSPGREWSTVGGTIRTDDKDQPWFQGASVDGLSLHVKAAERERKRKRAGQCDDGSGCATERTIKECAISLALIRTRSCCRIPQQKGRGGVH